MKNLSVARRYAKALFELAQEAKIVSDVVQGMSNVSHALLQTPELAKILFNPLIRPDEKKAIVGKITSNPLILKFILLLAKRERLVQFQSIYEELRALADEANGISRVVIRTPSVLNDAQKKKIETELARTFGGKVEGRFEVNAELIGGVWIQMKDRVLDTTVKGRMDDLRYTLTHSHN